MYTWYQRSEIGYAYLSDVQLWNKYIGGDIWGNYVLRIMKSQWWTRGWTMQELIVPRKLNFYVNKSPGWSKIGSRIALVDSIVKRTGVGEGILRGEDVMKCSVAQRMS
jgi:hypothetical protein